MLESFLPSLQLAINHILLGPREPTDIVSHPRIDFRSNSRLVAQNLPSLVTVARGDFEKACAIATLIIGSFPLSPRGASGCPCLNPNHVETLTLRVGGTGCL